MTQEQIDMIYFERGYKKLKNIPYSESPGTSQARSKYRAVLAHCYFRFNHLAYQNPNNFIFKKFKSKMNAV